MSTILDKQHVTLSTLMKMKALPGQLDIHIHQLKGHYVPFVFHTAPDEMKLGYGPIVADGQMVANPDYEALVEALHESLGTDVKIYSSSVPPANAVAVGPSVTMH